MVARIATGEEVEVLAEPKGAAGGRARAANLSTYKRKRIAKAGAEARWKPKENVMSFNDKFSDAFTGGLSDIKFCVRGDSPTVAKLKEDALAFRDAIASDRIKAVDGVD